MEVVNALGRRKRAIARIFVSEGTGKITINKKMCIRDRLYTYLVKIVYISFGVGYCLLLCKGSPEPHDDNIR